MPSSTSQSVLTELRGSMMSSSGPWMHDNVFMKTIGSLGTGMPDSAAWSE